ncbi:MAG: hypothetical protein II842_10205 [Butyrivibrio sp.]|nr:hypothetical protein [Butyrivibrio sp.]
MSPKKKQKPDIDFRILGVILIFVISLAVNIFFCFQKMGFHEDEYYTYYSSNRSIGLYQPDRQWQDRATITEEFTVKPSESFNYGMVSLVQSWDVHPPVYYFIFHTICSFFSLVFTKWTGLITNLIAFVLGFLLFDKLLEMLEIPYYLRLTILAFWGMNPQTVSCNLFIRMYAWLSLFIIACATIHVGMIQRIKRVRGTGNYYSNVISGRYEGKAYGNISNARFFVYYFLPLIVTSFLGFLTQYFYLLFFVPIGFYFVIWIFFFKRDYIKGVIYIIACGLSLLLAVLAYPASLHQIFGGYRGNGATESLLDIANSFMRISFFAGLLNDFVFAGLLPIIIAVIVLVLVAVVFLGREYVGTVEDDDYDRKTEFGALAFGGICYFLLASKAALLVGSASNRYEMPIYGIIIVLLFSFWDKYLAKLNKYLTYAILPLVAIALLAKAYAFDKNILFLYPEDQAKVEYAAENSDQVAIVMFNPATPHNVWRLTNEILEYPEVFYMDEENLEPVTDERVLAAEKILLYVADDDQQEDAINGLIKATGLTEKEQVFTEDMWSTYVLSK